MAFNKSFLGSTMGGFAIGRSLTGVNFGGAEFKIFAKSPFNIGGVVVGPFTIIGMGGGGGGGGATGVCCFGGEACLEETM